MNMTNSLAPSPRKQNRDMFSLSDKINNLVRERQMRKLKKRVDTLEKNQQKPHPSPNVLRQASWDLNVWCNHR